MSGKTDYRTLSPVTKTTFHQIYKKKEHICQHSKNQNKINFTLDEKIKVIVKRIEKMIGIHIIENAERAHLKLLQHLQQQVQTSFSNISFSMPKSPYDRVHNKLHLLAHKLQIKSGRQQDYKI